MMVSLLEDLGVTVCIAHWCKMLASLPKCCGYDPWLVKGLRSLTSMLSTALMLRKIPIYNFLSISF